MIRRLLNDSMRLARDGVVRSTSMGIRVLRRMRTLLDPDPESGSRPSHGTMTSPETLRLRPELVEQFRDLLGVEEGDEEDGRHGEEIVRKRFAELLELSQQPDAPSGTHPAFEQIVDQISPDEARIIRLLGAEGPQPVISVVATPRLGWGSQTLIEHVSLIGDRAGCHEPDRTPAYVDNLARLGVARLFDEELVGAEDYEVLEVQPEVKKVEERITEEMHQRAKYVRKRLALTGLGEQFAEVVFPSEGEA